MSDAERDQLAEKLKGLALRFLGSEPGKEERWEEAFRKAVRFHRMAQRAAAAAESRRQGPEYASIQQLIKDGELGGSKDVGSVFEKRIRPRIPTEAELEQARKHFRPNSEDMEEQLLQKAFAAAQKAGIRDSRLPGSILALCNWLDCYDDIKVSGTLHWHDDRRLILCERAIVEPTHPPTMGDLKPQIEAAMSELQSRLCEI